MPAFPLDRYLRYDELTERLHDFAAAHPDLVRISSIGKSHEGREIWLATVTDFRTGDDRDKPAFWADGNIHASEVSASSAVLCLLELVVEGAEGTYADLLKQRALYLVPRLNPDGAEWSLEVPPRVIRSSTRRYPFDEEDAYGVERKDLDGDGRILQMRVPDPNGPWKISDVEPRLLVRRSPGESGGRYFRVLPEGIVHNYDGISLRPKRTPEGLDLNRNFPSAWRVEAEQHGAGPYPTSEPEVRAGVQAIVDRPNICGGISFHTFSGVLLRPPSRHPDDEMPPEDLWAYQEIGKVGREMTGYPDISNWHEFRYHPKEIITGVFDDWMLEHRGVHAWTVEIWSPQRQAGITDYKYIDWFRDHPHEDDLKLLSWSDSALDGQGHIDWMPFDHPQLGPVEIGGWDSHLAFRNPPPKFLESEVRPLAQWAAWHAGLGPRLEHRKTVVDDLGGAWRIRVAVQNTGWLPTNVTRLAGQRKLVGEVAGEIEGPAGELAEWLAAGHKRQEAGQLRGYSETPAGGFAWHIDATDDVAVFEWVVTKPGTYRVVCSHERAGRVRLEVAVGETS